MVENNKLNKILIGKILGLLIGILFIIILIITINTIYYYNYDDLCSQKFCSSKYTYNAYILNINKNQSNYYYNVDFIITKNNLIIDENYKINIIKDNIKKYKIKIGNEIYLYKNCNNKSDLFYLEQQYKIDQGCFYNTLSLVIHIFIGIILTFIILLLIYCVQSNIENIKELKIIIIEKVKNINSKKLKKKFRKLWKKIKKIIYCNKKNKNNFIEMEFVEQKSQFSSSSDEEGSYIN